MFRVRAHGDLDSQADLRSWHLFFYRKHPRLCGESLSWSYTSQLSLLLCPLSKPSNSLGFPSPSLDKKGSGSHPDCGGITYAPFLLRYRFSGSCLWASPGTFNSLLREGCYFPPPPIDLFPSFLFLPSFLMALRLPCLGSDQQSPGQVLATAGLFYQDTLYIHHLCLNPLNCLHSGLHTPARSSALCEMPEGTVC